MKIFDQLLVKKPNKNVFDLSHEVKTTANMGELIPFFNEEVVPGDKFNVSSEVLVRLAPMLAPVMHRVDVYTHFFFIPNRLLWSDWEEFITGGEDGLSALTPPGLVIDENTKDYFRKGSLADYLGIPPVPHTVTITNPVSINQLPFRACLKVYNDYYRDQNLEEELDFDDPDDLLTVKIRAWEKDYFTSALPWAQRGGAVQIPIAGSAPVGASQAVIDGDETQVWENNNMNEGGMPVTLTTNTNPGQIAGSYEGFMSADGTNNTIAQLMSGLEADLSQASATTINDLRKATRLQEWLERNARGGSRYIEQILSHFGVRSSDSRLQRAEYLGGGKQPIVISEVLQTTDTVDQHDGNPLGAMGGHGISVGKSNNFSKFFEEHGYVIGMLSVMPRTTYQNGIHKTFLRTDKLDYYWPEFAQIGEQEVKNAEVSVGNYQAPADHDGTFGYQMRYGEYKYKSSQVSGDMRDTLNFWHFGRDFAGQVPNLNNNFVKAVVRQDPFAVTDESVHKLIFQIFNRVKAVRPMPYFNIPTL